MDLPPGLVFLVMFIVFFVVLYRKASAERDPEWEGQWRRLPARERLRISKAAREGEALEDHRDVELAAGSARQQRQLTWGSSTSATGQIVIGSVVALAGIAQGSILIAVGGLALVGLGIWRVNRARSVNRNLRRAEEADRG